MALPAHRVKRGLCRDQSDRTVPIGEGGAVVSCMAATGIKGTRLTPPSETCAPFPLRSRIQLPFCRADAPLGPHRLGPDRDREPPLEMQIPFDSHAKGQPDRRHLAQRPGAELRVAQIGESEEDISVLIELGGQPGALAEGVSTLCLFMKGFRRS